MCANRRSSARAALAKCAALGQTKSPRSASGDSGLTQADDAVAGALKREAEALIETKRRRIRVPKRQQLGYRRPVARALRRRWRPASRQIPLLSSLRSPLGPRELANKRPAISFFCPQRVTKAMTASQEYREHLFQVRLRLLRPASRMRVRPVRVAHPTQKYFVLLPPGFRITR